MDDLVGIPMGEKTGLLIQLRLESAFNHNMLCSIIPWLTFQISLSSGVGKKRSNHLTGFLFPIHSNRFEISHKQRLVGGKENH